MADDVDGIRARMAAAWICLRAGLLDPASAWGEIHACRTVLRAIEDKQSGVPRAPMH